MHLTLILPTVWPNENTANATYHSVEADAGKTITFTITVTSKATPSCGTETANYVLTVNKAPTATITTAANAEICVGSTFALTGAATNGTVQWTTTGAGSFDDPTSETPTYQSADTDAGKTITFTMTVDSNTTPDCGTATATYDLKVNGLPTATIDTPVGGQVCADGSFPLTATISNGTPLWTIVSGGGTLSNAGTTTPTYSPADGDVGNPVTLRLTVTSDKIPSCGNATADYDLTVNGLPTAQIDTPIDAEICSDGSYTFAGTATNGSILWTSNGGGSITGNTTATPIYNAVAADAGKTIVITMTVTSSFTPSCGTAVAHCNLKVNPLPVATINTSAGGQVCADGTFQLNATAANGSFAWTIVSGNGTLSNDNTTMPVYNATESDAGNVVVIELAVTSTFNPSCGVAKATYNLQVNGLPTADITTAPGAEICGYDTFAPTATATNGNILWTAIGGTGTFTGENTTNPVYTPAANDQGKTITLRMTVTSPYTPSCGVVYDEYQLVVNPVPEIEKVITPSVCPDAPLAFDALPNNYASYQWTIDGVLDGTKNGSTYAYEKEKYSGQQITISVVAVSDKGCNSVPFPALSQVNLIPEITLLNNHFCVEEYGNKVIWRDLVSTSEGLVRWYETEDKAKAIIPDNIDQSVPGTYKLYAVALSGNGCESDVVQVPVTVNENPVLDHYDTSDIDNVRAFIGGGLKPYTWHFDGIYGTTESVVNLGAVAIGKNRLYIVDRNGCELDTMVPLLEYKLIPDPYFSPNGDGQGNERWNITNLERYVDDDVTIQIFDRTGKELARYTAREFLNADGIGGWNGEFNGRELPSTDYWYLITFGKLGGDTMTGHFTLKR